MQHQSQMQWWKLAIDRAACISLMLLYVFGLAPVMAVAIHRINPDSPIGLVVGFAIGFQIWWLMLFGLSRWVRWPLVQLWRRLRPIRIRAIS